MRGVLKEGWREVGCTEAMVCARARGVAQG